MKLDAALRDHPGRLRERHGDGWESLLGQGVDESVSRVPSAPVPGFLFPKGPRE